MRQTEFGSPFKNLNSGREETADKENLARVQRAYTNYLASEQGQLDAKSFVQPAVSKSRAQLTSFLGPLAGALFGKFLGDVVSAPGSIYLRKFMIVGFGIIGYKYSLDVWSSHQVGFQFRNFHHFPIEIQQALKSYDSRYARKWLE